MAENDYQYWQDALTGIFGPVHDGDPRPGFYRKRTGKAKGYDPVAIWRDGAAMVALVNGKTADANEIWTYVCQHPCSEEHYHARMNSGKWHDEDEAVTESLSPPPMGHNNAPTDPAEILAEQIQAALAGVTDYAEVQSDEAAAKAQSLRSRLLELSGDADKERDKQKRPHLEAGRVIDALFQPLVKEAKAGADTIRAALSAFETAKDKARRAAEAEAAKVIEEARKAAVAAAEAGKPPPPPPPPAPEPIPETSTKIAGSYGRAASIKTKKVATVVDIDAAFIMLKTHKELIELIGKLAQRATDAGYEVPGVTVEEVKDVR